MGKFYFLRNYQGSEVQRFRVHRSVNLQSSIFNLQFRLVLNALLRYLKYKRMSTFERSEFNDFSHPDEIKATKISLGRQTHTDLPG
jgi:hypothetical protein